MQKKRVCIAIPASFVSDVPHLRDKTLKIGLIGRATAIFGVNEIIVYPDNPKVRQTADIDLIATLLAYMETPQYLRKRLFKLRPELQYVGILPPLRTPHHPLNRRAKLLKIGEYREGVTLSETKKGTLLDIGVEQPVLIPKMQLPVSRRATVKVTRIGKRVEVEVEDRREIPMYWGYIVTVENRSFSRLVKDRSFDLTIATSKHGLPFADVAEEITRKAKKANDIFVAFGAPTQGLYEIAKNEGHRLDDLVDFVVNVIPRQGTETVRTEEALFASLAILNMQLRV